MWRQIKGIFRAKHFKILDRPSQSHDLHISSPGKVLNDVHRDLSQPLTDKDMQPNVKYDELI